jgi:Na+-driven multidrug efflux pump
VFTWVIFVPSCYLLTHFTSLDILILYPVCYAADLVKCIIGIAIVKAGKWTQNMVAVPAEKNQLEPADAV